MTSQTTASSNTRSKPRMVQSSSTSSMRLHRDFIRKMSWVEAMLGLTYGTEEYEKMAKKSGILLNEQMELEKLKRQSSPSVMGTSPTKTRPHLVHSHSETTLALSKKKRHALELDHYYDYKQDQEFFQKKLVQPKTNTANLTPTTLAKEKERAQELKNLESLAREQSDVVVCFLTEVIYYLITASTKAASQQGPAQPPPKPQSNVGKSFLSLDNLKSFIFNSLKKNNKSEKSTASAASTTTSSGSSSPSNEVDIPVTKQDALDTKEQETKAEIKQFLQKVISRIPVDPRLHVVALMYFDRFIHIANVMPLKQNPKSSSSISRTLSKGVLKHSRSKSSDDLPISSISKHFVTLENYHKYFAMCIVLASKMWEDRFYSNLSYFELFGLPSPIDFPTFNETEGVILGSLKFELHVTHDAFRDYIEHYSKLLHGAIYKNLIV